MPKRLEKLTLWLCESLPLDFTLYEGKGFCQKPNEQCHYCKKRDEKVYFCNKKTYMLDQELKFA